MKNDPSDPRISAYLLGELGDDASQAFENEMAQSADLRELVRGTRETIDRLQSELSATLPDGFERADEIPGSAKFAATLDRVLPSSDAAGGSAASAAADGNGQVTIAAQPRSSETRSRQLRWAAAGIGLLSLALLVAYAILIPGLEDRDRLVAQSEPKSESRFGTGDLGLRLRGTVSISPTSETPGQAADKSEGLESLHAAWEASWEAGAEPTGPPAESMLGDEVHVEASRGSAAAGESQPVPATRLWSNGRGAPTAGVEERGGQKANHRDSDFAVDGYVDAIEVTRPVAPQPVEAPAISPDSSGIVGGGMGGMGGGGRGGMGGGGRSEGHAGGGGAVAPQEPFSRGRPASFGVDRQRVGNYSTVSSSEAAPAAMPTSGPGATEYLRTERERRTRKYYVPAAPQSDLSKTLPMPPAERTSGDRYESIAENTFLRVTDAPLSTFSIDVDSASYAKVRMYLQEHHRLPQPDAVRIEELINYFPYGYAGPESGPHEDGDPFAAHLDVVTCPWNPAHKLVRIGLKGREVEPAARPRSNLVFLLDVSGSMDQPNKLPLLKRGMQMLTEELSENDRVAIVVYAGESGMVLDSTTGDRQDTILDALARLHAGGSTNGGEGIQLAYQTALDNFVEGGVNRVILCTDGDFNVGVTGTDQLVRMVDRNAKTGVFLSVLGFGMGNLNDAMLEQISNKGNGNYAFVDSESEARKVLVEQMAGTLVTIAKDVKLQVEFNPANVAAYRLIGYENRVLAARDFNDDKKDAGEIGAGHTVTALYEVVPVDGSSSAAAPVDGLRYQKQLDRARAAHDDELLTLKVRYKQPTGNKSRLLTFPLVDSQRRFHQADRDFQFAAAVASFGMLLRCSPHAGDASFDSVLELAAPAAKHDQGGYRREFLELVRTAARLHGKTIPHGQPYRR